MAEANENTPLLGATGGASSLPGAEGSTGSFIFSPGGNSLSHSYSRSLGVGSGFHRPRGAMKTGRGTGRRVTPVDTTDASDPLRGKRKKMPYESLVKELENNPESEIIRISPGPSQVTCDNQRLRLKYYNKCRTYAHQQEREAEQRLRRELESNGVYEAIIEDVEHDISREDNFLVYPDHLLTPRFFILQTPLSKDPLPGQKQSSWVTVLSIWNTMMGTSLLSVPWAISQSGLVMGLAIGFLMSMISGYTASIILRTHRRESQFGSIPEFAQMCGKLMGPFYEYLGSFFSLLAVTGAAVVYWVLMSNFLYNTVTFVYDKATGSSHIPGNSSHGVYCPNDPDFKNGMDDFLVTSVGNGSTVVANGTSSEALFDTLWNPQTVPCYLLVLLPLISLRSISFFTKFNSLGTVTVLFLIGVVTYYASIWGINVNFEDANSTEYVPMFKSSFFCLSGMLALGLFIHNAIITIVSNNRYPENNVRDTYIAFVLVAVTYMFIGVVFYISFPLPKSCIEDDFLNNFHLDDPLTVACRALILFQLITVFPLIMYILRNQAFLLLIGRQQEKLVHISIVNLVVLTVCILFAVFYPSIGTIIRFSGAFCGFIIIFLLPCLVHMKSQYKENQLTKTSIVIHSSFILLGLANVLAQFHF